MGAAMGGASSWFARELELEAGMGRSFGGCSFAAETSVAMADGSSKPISKLRVGDMVEAYDPSTGETGPHRVSAVMVNRDPATEHLGLDTGAVETTPNHPFYTTDRGWIEAGQLRAGEHVRTATGSAATVLSFTVDAHPATMWDITVAGAHSFFVGSGEVLVHNACPVGAGGPRPPANWIDPTNPPQLPPSQLAPGWTLRVEPPNSLYPNGYWRLYNPLRQPVDPSTMLPPGNVSKALFQAKTHVPFPPGTKWP
jgi:hypothetical protein